jgi:predicted O-methyltransferase YrrM
MGKIKLLIKYIVYWFRRNGAKGHGIHSPFVFRFNREVLNSRIVYGEYREIRNYLRSLTASGEIIDVLDHGAGSRLFSSGSRRVSSIARHVSSSYRTGKLLFRLARSLNPCTVVEMGTSVGFGTLCLALGAIEGEVFSLEACPSQHAIASRELGRAGIRNVRLIRGTFAEELPRLLAATGKIDMAYFDGDHRKESVIWQFRQCLPMAMPGTVFVIGDINWSPGMNEAWEAVRNDPAVNLSIDLFHCGLAIFREGVEKQHFILDYTG